MIITGIGKYQYASEPNCIKFLIIRTLQYVAANFFNSTLQCVYPYAARVLHIGNCGRHHKFGDCDASRDLEAYKSMSQAYKKNLFPVEMKQKNVLEIPHIYDINNGGWSDIRDHMLCNSFVNSTI